MFEPFKEELLHFDFNSKRDLIDAFADYCADLHINVFEGQGNKFGIGICFNWNEVDEKYSEKLFDKMGQSEKISDWKVFVRTPLGACKIGYSNLLSYMKRLNSWIIDPYQMRVNTLKRK